MQTKCARGQTYLHRYASEDEHNVVFDVNGDTLCWNGAFPRTRRKLIPVDGRITPSERGAQDLAMVVLC